ncbi:microtubule-associated protein futsch [Xyrauchen texanus]|uniref:microtubule-associated protein futsch n=1 Tax=Xyrauchen texanus TaxID=154827 RepID=UPI00224256E4|nr:microtubule-associated protein futsch [Xyrauchen texanus]
MGQNQGKEGELGQDNGSAEPEEKGPSPEPGGPTEEGNPSIETCSVEADEEKAANGRLDESPGRESTSPTLDQGLDSHDKVCAPTDRGLVEGGNGEKKGERESSEEGRAEPLAPQKLNGIRRSDCCTQGIWEATNSEPAHKREDMEKAEAGETTDFESKLEDHLEHNRVRQHQENSGYVKDKMESVYGDENMLRSQEEDRGLEADVPNVPNINTSRILKAASDNGLTKTGPVVVTTEMLKRKDIPTPMDPEDTSHATDRLANSKVHFQVFVSPTTGDNVKLKTSAIKSQDKRLMIEPSMSSPLMNLPTETSKNITEVIQKVKDIKQENSPENPDKDATETQNTEHSFSLKNVETQGHTMTDVCRVREKALQPTDDVIKTRFTSSLWAGAELINKAVSLEREQTPEDLRPLEVASKSPQGHIESHQQIFACKFKQDEHQKEMQFDVSDLESVLTKESSLERSPAGGQKNKDGMRETEEIDNLESASKGLHCSQAMKTEIKDLSLHGTETEEGYCVTSNIASAIILDENKTLQQKYEDEKQITSSEDIMDSHPPTKSNIQATQKNEMEDSPLLEKAKVHTEKYLECFLDVINSQPEIQTFPETVKDATHKLYPEFSFSLSTVIDVDGATDQQRLNTNKVSVNMTSSERLNPSQTNQNVIKSNTDKQKETFSTSSISEHIAGPETASGLKEDRPRVTPPFSSVDKKTKVDLSGSLLLLPNESTHSIVILTDVSDQVQDICDAGVALPQSKTNTSASQDVHHSASMCNQISMQANEKHNKELNKLSTQAQIHVLTSNTEEKNSIQLNLQHATEGGSNILTTDSPAKSMETQQSSQKRHVSDMIKETIELQKRMKEWTKPMEAQVDLTLDPTQSVKVSQMKAAFDPPKQSPDKALERKTSVRKGKSSSEKNVVSAIH